MRYLVKELCSLILFIKQDAALSHKPI